MHKKLPSIEERRSESSLSVPRVFVLRLKAISERDKEVALLVECEETWSMPEREVTKACLSFHYQVISGDVGRRHYEGGDFSACCETHLTEGSRVRLTSTSTSVNNGGYCVVDPTWLRGRGIGTFFMNEIVHWVRQWPDAKVIPVNLLASDAHEENKVRRNRFYENFGLTFEHEDDRKLAGRSLPMLAEELTPLSQEAKASLREKLEWCNLNEYLSEHVRERDMLEMDRWGLQNQLRSSSKDWSRACRSPFRWAIATFVSQIVRGY